MQNMENKFTEKTWDRGQFQQMFVILLFDYFSIYLLNWQMVNLNTGDDIGINCILASTNMSIAHFESVLSLSLTAHFNSCLLLISAYKGGLLILPLTRNCCHSYFQHSALYRCHYKLIIRSFVFTSLQNPNIDWVSSLYLSYRPGLLILYIVSNTEHDCYSKWTTVLNPGAY